MTITSAIAPELISGSRRQQWNPPWPQALGQGASIRRDGLQGIGVMSGARCQAKPQSLRRGCFAADPVLGWPSKSHRAQRGWMLSDNGPNRMAPTSQFGSPAIEHSPPLNLSRACLRTVPR